MRTKRLISAGALIADFLLWGLLCFLIAMGAIYSDGVRQYSSASLRYDTPVSGRTAYAARQYSIAHSDDKIFWPTFWTENRASFSGGFVTVTANCIAFSGDASLVWPAKYINGSAPGTIDADGCAVSEALAWRLWGSTDVVGMTVEIDGTGRIVRGVFTGKEEVAIASFRDDDVTRKWYAVELAGATDSITREDAQLYATASGLGQPSFVLTGDLSFFSSVIMVLPLLILAVYGLGIIVRLIRKQYPAARKFIPFLLLIAIAAVLPAIIERFPEWLIPTRWSDFSFWGSVLARASDGLREFLRAAPQSRDVELKLRLLRQAGVSVLTVCLSLVVCFRWHIGRTGSKFRSKS